MQKIDPKVIRKARRALDLTQTDAARIIGVAKRTWQSWEAGTRNMPVKKWELWQFYTTSFNSTPSN